MDPGRSRTLLRAFVGDKSVLHNRAGEQSSDGVSESVCSSGAKGRFKCQSSSPVSSRKEGRSLRCENSMGDRGHSSTPTSDL